MKPNIIKAMPETADTLTEIALAAKRYWGYPEHWMAQWRSMLTITPAFVRDNEVYAAVDAAGNMTGFYALVGTGKRVVLDDLWVRPEHIGTGVGRALLTHAVARAAALHAEEIELEADPHAAGFYERMGAQRIGEIDAPMDGLERHLPVFVIRVPNLVEYTHAHE
jgi:GNAT superfamily N-acetyltransferase